MDTPRTDTRKFLTEKDVENGSSYQLYVWNENTDSIAKVPGCLRSNIDSLGLSEYNIEPHLTFEGEVELADGSTAEVRTVFNLLQEKLADFSVEKASEISGVHPDVIRQIAEDLYNLKPATIIGG